MTRTPHAATSASPARPHGKAARFVVESRQPLTRRQVEARMLGDAFQARALALRVEPSVPLSRRIRAAIAIAFPLGVAAWAVLYFAAQMLRAVFA